MAPKNTRHVIVAVMKVKEFLDNNPANGISTATLAAMAGISRNVLQEAFKQQYGDQIGQYKLNLRMEGAKHLLLEGKSVKEVSILLQYASPSAFTNAFKNHVGITPTEWANSIP